MLFVKARFDAGPKNPSQDSASWAGERGYLRASMMSTVLPLNST
jgi:hypothetical protein